MSVSVVIPTYNRAALVVEAVRSVFAQKWEALEVIVVDDGSTDLTAEALSEFRAKSNFIYIHQENAGRSVARNAGLYAAKGAFVMFLDSDDILLPSALEDLYQASATDTQFIAGNRVFVDAETNIMEVEDHVRPKEEFYDADIRIWAIRDVFFAPSMYMVDRQTALRLSGYDRTTEPAEDYDFFIRYCDKGLVTYIQKDVVKMRRHESNTDEAELRKATIKIALKNLKQLRRNTPDDRAAISRWLERLGDDHYYLNEHNEAKKFYIEAMKLSLSVGKLGGNKFRLMRQLIASALPTSFKDRVKRR